MLCNESDVNSILDPIIESVLMRHDEAIGAAENQLRQVAGIAEDDDLAGLALFNLAHEANAALDEACGIAFWAGAAFARGVAVAVGAELVINED
jgi:hypothetical protein